VHGFVREVRPTQEEWFEGVKFLTETGHWCDDKRQEFILMSDTLGVSMLVDFINYGKEGQETESTVLGPFFVEGAPELPMGASIVKPGTVGEPCVASGCVKGADGKPIAGAVIDVWQAAGDGFYDVQTPKGTNLRARFRTGRAHAGRDGPAPDAPGAPALHDRGAGPRKAGDAPVRAR
jgi:hydroxyquinol 1,2-dioxygenase